jgi:hypothetical protein
MPERASGENATELFGGVQLLREFGIGQTYLGRVGGRIMSSLNSGSESVNMAIVDFQIGWGGLNREATTASNY